MSFSILCLLSKQRCSVIPFLAPTNDKGIDAMLEKIIPSASQTVYHMLSCPIVFEILKTVLCLQWRAVSGIRRWKLPKSDFQHICDIELDSVSAPFQFKWPKVSNVVTFLTMDVLGCARKKNHEKVWNITMLKNWEATAQVLNKFLVDNEKGDFSGKLSAIFSALLRPL